MWIFVCVCFWCDISHSNLKFSMPFILFNQAGYILYLCFLQNDLVCLFRVEPMTFGLLTQ